MTLHTAHSIKHGTTVLSGQTNINFGAGAQVSNETGIGSPYPQFVAITEQKPTFAFSTTMLAAALGVTGVTGAAIDVDGGDSLVAYFAKLGTDGLPVAASEHRSYTAAKGLLLPRRLQCTHRQPATLDVEALLYSSDGAAHPIVIADNAALPTLAVANLQHTLGPIQLGVSGTVFDFSCAESVAIDFGNGAQTRGCNSDIYDKHVEQPGIRPVITLTGLSAAVFGSAGVPPVGLKLTHAGTLIYLRKRNQGIGFVADATEEHILVTADGVAVVTQHTGQGTAAAQVTVQITCAWDGTNTPITIDTTSALPE